MTSLALAPDLPSEDEEDEDFDPDREPAGSGDDKPAKKTAGAKRSRGTFTRPGRHAEAGAEGSSEDDGPAPDPKTAAKRARASAHWDQLNSSSTVRRPAASSTIASSSTPATARPKAAGFSLSSMCKPISKAKSAPDHKSWMAQLGLLPKKAPQTHAAASAKPHRAAPAAGPALPTGSAAGAPGAQPTASGTGQPAVDAASAPEPPASVAVPASSPAAAAMLPEKQTAGSQQPDMSKALAAAAAALAAAKGATSVTAAQQHGKVTVTERRRFAGKDIEVAKQVAQSEADKSARKQAGLDAVLASLQATKKVNVLDKSRMDWTDYKSTNDKVEEELEVYKKSGDKYLDKVDFLKRAELREYEKERDKRLQGDVRNRGRL